MLFIDGSMVIIRFGFVRKKQFLSETDHVKYPDVQQKWRFELVEDIK